MAIEMETGIIYSERYLEHDLGPKHPEKPERLRSIIKSLKENKQLFEKVQMITPTPASKEDIELVHDRSYIEKVKNSSKSGKMLDLDTPTNPNTYELALLSAGGTLVMSEKIVEGELDNGFALVRPPGHHATRDSGGGFCYFNNIAIAAKNHLNKGDVERVLIFDFDSHHGNGTQDIFYRESNVLYVSFHQNGRTLYPGSGFPGEIGEDGGEGYTVNVPFSPGSTDENYAAALQEFLIPLSEQFDPDLILVSAGLDPHSEDPLTQLRLSSEGFEWLAKTAINQAEKLCRGKIGFVLEGGYAIEAATESTLKIIDSLANPEPPNLPVGKKKKSFRDVKKALGPYWKI